MPNRSSSSSTAKPPARSNKPAFAQSNQSTVANISKEILVFVDIPDPDNLLCCLSLLRGNPNAHVYIILSPRPVDFSVEPYPLAVYKMFSTEQFITPYSKAPDWVQTISDPEIKKHFTRVDAVFDGEEIDKNTRIYMETSAYRFARFLEDRGVSRNQYDIYWDEASMEKICPGVRHAQHRPDYTYGYDHTYDCDETSKKLRENQLAEHDEIMKLSDPLEPVKSDEITDEQHDEARGQWKTALKNMQNQRRNRLRKFCKKYNEYQQAFWVKKHVSKPILSKFDALIKMFEDTPRKAEDMSTVVGGPLTELYKWVVQKKKPTGPLVKMLVFIDGKDNKLPNQFNCHVDLVSAWKFLRHAVKHQVQVLLVPTECIKSESWKLSEKELGEIFDGHASVWQLFKKFNNREVFLFDWITAIVARQPGILPTDKPVVPFLTEGNNIVSNDVADALTLSVHFPTRVLRVRAPETTEDGGEEGEMNTRVTMCYNNPGPKGEVLKKFKDAVIEGLKADLKVETVD